MQSIIKISCSILIFTLVFPALLSADTIYLKNGNTLEGFVEKENPETVECNLGDGLVVFHKNEIARVTKSTPQQSQALWEKWAGEKKEEALRKPETAPQPEENTQESAQEKDEYGPKEVTAEVQNGHFVVNVLINGKIRAKLLLDSGATTVCLSRRLADGLEINVDELKKGSTQLADGRSVEVAQSLIETIEILNTDPDNPSESESTGITANNVEALFLTRTNDVIIETADKIYTPDDGLLGMSFLKHFQVNLDYKGGKIIFQKNREA